MCCPWQGGETRDCLRKNSHPSAEFCSYIHQLHKYSDKRPKRVAVKQRSFKVVIPIKENYLDSLQKHSGGGGGGERGKNFRRRSNVVDYKFITSIAANFSKLTRNFYYIQSRSC